MTSLILVTKGQNGIADYFLSKKWTLGRAKTLEVPLEGVAIEEVRIWLKSSFLKRSEKETAVYLIKGADNLSIECQNTLLRPLEEPTGGVQFLLTVQSQNRLLPTILSRCLVVEAASVDKKSRENKEEREIWKRVISAWQDSSSACIALSDELLKIGAEKVFLIFFKKLSGGLRQLPTKKKLVVLRTLLDCWRDLRLRVNPRLVMDRFLFEGWKVIQA